MAKLKKMTINSQKQRKKFDKEIRQLKLAHRLRILAINAKVRYEKKMWQKRLAAQNIANRKRFDQEFTRLKKSYQLQLENIRQIYNNQAALQHAEMEDAFDKQVKVNTENFKNMVAVNNSQLEKLQKWLHDELVTQLIEKRQNIENSDIEQVRLAADLKIKKLREALDEREMEAQHLKERVQKMEAKKAVDYAKLLSRKMRGALLPNDEIDNVPERRGNEHEIMSMIKEIAQEKLKQDKALQDSRLTSE